MDTNPPRRAEVGVTPPAILANIHVVDTATGAVIARVTMADVDAGKVRRFEVDGDGNLVRRNDTFAQIEEDRAIAIEWIDPRAPVVSDAVQPNAPLAPTVAPRTA